MEERVRVKITYFIGTSSDRFLALTRRVPATFIPPLSGYPAGDELGYGKVALRHCLAQIVGTSPELVADPTRDYTVYVADPLEPSHAPLTLPTPLIKPSSSSMEPIDLPGGPAVGMGLLSWCLAEEDSEDEPFIVGPLAYHPAAGNVVCVVLSLRETTSCTRAEQDHLIKTWAKQSSLPVADQASSSSLSSSSSRPPLPVVAGPSMKNSNPSSDKPYWALVPLDATSKAATSSPAIHPPPRVSLPPKPQVQSQSRPKAKPKGGKNSPTEPTEWSQMLAMFTKACNDPNADPNVLEALRKILGPPGKSGTSTTMLMSEPQFVFKPTVAPPSAKIQSRVAPIVKTAPQSSSPVMPRSASAVATRPKVPAASSPALNARAVAQHTPASIPGLPRPIFIAPPPVPNVQYTLPRPAVAVSVTGLGPVPSLKENRPPLPRGTKRAAETPDGGATAPPKKRPSPRGACSDASNAPMPVFARPVTPPRRAGIPPSSSPLFAHASSTPRATMTSSPPRMSSPTPTTRRSMQARTADLPPSSPLPPTSDAEIDEEASASSAMTTPASQADEDQADADLCMEVFGMLQDDMVVSS